jgi:hypothetical protein
MIEAIDNVLKKLIPIIKTDSSIFPNKDKRILTSLSNQIDQGHFLTENQSKLMVKILSENAKAIEPIEPDIKNIIEQGSWSQIFRVIQRVRKISLSEDQENLILVEFTYDKRLKEKLISLNSKIDGSISAVGSKVYALALTEKNIHFVISTFLKDDFEIHEKIMNFYFEIDKILKNEVDLFDIKYTTDENFKRVVYDRMGDITQENLLVLHDRKIRYQYTFSEKIGAETLSSKIAMRHSTKVFISNSSVGLATIIDALKELKRFPALVIFEGHDPKINKKHLEMLASAVQQSNIQGDIGIYFRFDKDADTCLFNKAIADLSYNKQLTTSTAVAGIANSKIPKFLLKTDWKPKTVISFTTNFKNNKSAVYCNNVDLIVYYTDRKPLNEDVDVIV